MVKLGLEDRLDGTGAKISISPKSSCSNIFQLCSVFSSIIDITYCPLSIFLSCQELYTAVCISQSHLWNICERFQRYIRQITAYNHLVIDKQNCRKKLFLSIFLIPCLFLYSLSDYKNTYLIIRDNWIIVSIKKCFLIQKHWSGDRQGYYIILKF